MTYFTQKRRELQCFSAPIFDIKDRAACGVIRFALLNRTAARRIDKAFRFRKTILSRKNRKPSISSARPFRLPPTRAAHGTPYPYI